MLLTGSQLSMIISFGTVLLCTSALFIAGTFIQQKTVRGMHEIIRPRLPEPALPIALLDIRITSDEPAFGGAKPVSRRSSQNDQYWDSDVDAVDFTALLQADDPRPEN